MFTSSLQCPLRGIKEKKNEVAINHRFQTEACEPNTQQREP